MGIKRTSVWLESSGNERIFTWFHYAPKVFKSTAVVIVGPLGPEYMHCYRTLRCLADELAEQKVLVARYDHPGMGDSTGNLEDDNIWESWVAAPEIISEYMKSMFGVDDVIVLGLRSASLLLEKVVSSKDSNKIIYWYPYIRGASFVRDIATLDSMLNLDKAESDSTLDGGGYPLTLKNQNILKSINLNKVSFSENENLLIIESAGLPGNTKFINNLKNQNIHFDKVELDGLTSMARQAALSVVPFDNINYICEWVKSHIFSNEMVTVEGVSSNGLEEKLYTETIIKINAVRQQYAILTRPKNIDKQSSSELIVFSNAGVAHHIGPNRFHVESARQLAKEGVATLRLDLSNIGESVEVYDDEKHHPYPCTAAQDLNNVVSIMRFDYVFKKVILAGLCSGAHNAFHAALDENSDLNGIILINPLTFYWQPGQSIFEPEDNQSEIDSVYYQKNMFDVKKWLNLLLSPKKIMSIGGFVFRIVYKKLSAGLATPLKKMGLIKLNDFEKDVSSIFNKGVGVSVIYSDTDPGFSILMSQAGLVVRQGVKKGLFSSMLITNADHTFSSRESRKKLISYIKSSIGFLKK